MYRTDLRPNALSRMRDPRQLEPMLEHVRQASSDCNSARCR